MASKQSAQKTQAGKKPPQPQVTTPRQKKGAKMTDQTPLKAQEEKKWTPAMVVVAVFAAIGLILFGFFLSQITSLTTLPTPTPTPTEDTVARKVAAIATEMAKLAEEVHAPTPTPVPTPTAMPATDHPPAVPTSRPAPSGYPLAGTTYSSPQGNEYNAVWTTSGWLWQPNLPPEGSRKGHVLSITIEKGRYTFNGVSCRLHLDEKRNGRGADNPRTVGYGNGLPFEVDTADGGQAWAIVVCDPTDVTGFSIQYEGPLP